jgi:hypothetical protein
MILWDVNLWVYAFRADSPLHGPAFREIDVGSRTAEPFLFCPHVAASFLRLVTNARIFVEPSSSAEAWQFVDALESRASAVRVDLDAMAWGVFKHVCLVSRSVGNRVTDAFLAALAIRHDATLVTADRDFARFEGLACRFIAA